LRVLRMERRMVDALDRIGREQPLASRASILPSVPPNLSSVIELKGIGASTWQNKEQ
jgi:hypothetical protein